MSGVTPLEELGYPLFHEIEDTDEVDLRAPETRLGQAQRVRVRALEGMQKEALVTNSASGTTWRLVSDEGEYLDGHDVAPCPLSFFATGMVSSFANQILRLGDRRGIEIRDVELVLDTFYTMKGSALRGDMTGGALSPELEAIVDSPADEATLSTLVEDAVACSPVTGLVERELDSRFALALNGTGLSTDEVADLGGLRLADPEPIFEALPRDAAPQDDPNVVHTGRKTEDYPDEETRYTAGEGSSLQEEQDRILHVRVTCTLRDDGVKRVEHELYSPKGSVFEVLSDEPEDRGGRGRAPDAMTYAAAGIGFCFMTQFGRYADIVDADLSAYRIVQDTHFSAVRPAGAEPGEADPVETHVFLESSEGEEFARDVLDMSEQTCFLHALCRSDLEPVVDVTTP